jgi:pimeloyl-ACP methyl ester carboxylesterase
MLKNRVLSLARGTAHCAWQQLDHAARPVTGMELGRFVHLLPSLVRGTVAEQIAGQEAPARFRHDGCPAVMLVPGLFCTPSVMNRLGRALVPHGLDVYLPRPFPYYRGLAANTARLTLVADLLVEDLERLARKDGVAEVTLVGHSYGGVIVLTALVRARAMSQQPVCRLPAIAGAVLLAPPLGGAPIARPLAAFVPACRDLVPGAAALRRVRPAADGIRRILVSGRDSLVPEASQQALAAETVLLPGFQHTDFLVGTEAQLQLTARAVAEAIITTRAQPRVAAGTSSR